MSIEKFIEKYCLIKDKNNNKLYNIKLKDYQLMFIDYLKNIKRLST